MRRQILAIAILSVTTSPAAFAKDLPLMGTQADESGNSATLEIVDQKNTIKVTCETFQIQAWTPSEDDKGDSTSLDCGGVSIDANSPLLWDYANKKQQLEKALLSFKTVKGQSYTIEMPNVLITHLSVLSDSIGIQRVCRHQSINRAAATAVEVGFAALNPPDVTVPRQN